MEKILDEITGVYKSPHDLYQMNIQQKGGILYAEMDTDDGLINIPIRIDPQDFDLLEFKISTPLPSKEIIKFIRSPESNKVHFASYDRYLYRKC